MAAQAVYVGHAEIDARFVGHGQQVEHRVGRAAHGDVQGHGVEEGLACGDAQGQYAVVALVIVAFGIAHDEACGIFEEASAVGVGGQEGFRQQADELAAHGAVD